MINFTSSDKVKQGTAILLPNDALITEEQRYEILTAMSDNGNYYSETLTHYLMVKNGKGYVIPKSEYVRM